MGAFRDIATCIFCKSKRTVAHKEWIRASRPRCLNCGGPLEISESARKQHMEHSAAKSESEDSRK